MSLSRSCAFQASENDCNKSMVTADFDKEAFTSPLDNTSTFSAVTKATNRSNRLLITKNITEYILPERKVNLLSEKPKNYLVNQRYVNRVFYLKNSFLCRYSHLVTERQSMSVLRGENH